MALLIATITTLALLLGVPHTPGVGDADGAVVGDELGVGIEPSPPPRSSFEQAATVASANRLIQYQVAFVGNVNSSWAYE